MTGPSTSRTRSAVATGGRTIVRTDVVRVFRTGENSTVACHLRSGRRTRLGDSGPVDSNTVIRVGKVRVAGRLVAYDLTQVEPQSRNVRIVVLDARSGRRRSHAAEPHAGYVLRDLRPEVTDLELNAAGGAVWIVNGQWSEPGGLEVHWAVPGQTGLADSGPDVRPGSLALTGTRYYWTKGDAPYTATLPSS